MAYEDDKIRKVERGPSIWFWIVAAIVLIAAIIIIFSVLNNRNDENVDVVAPPVSDGVDTVDNTGVDTVDVNATDAVDDNAGAADDLVTPDEGASLPAILPFVVDGVQVMVA